MLKSKILKVFLSLVMIMLVAVLTSCGSASKGSLLRVPSSSDDYIGMNYEMAVSELQGLGFINFTMNPIEDLSSGSLISDGDIEQISINGDTSFKAKSKFSSDILVEITYHTIKKIATPISSEDVQDLDYESIGKAFIDAGFTNVSTTELFDIDPDINDSTYTNIVLIDSVPTFETAELFPFDAVISVVCHRPFEKYTVKIHVDFLPNLIFSKYDVDLLIDDTKQETLAHGKDADFEFRLKAGDHKIAFANVNSSSVNGQADIKVESDLDEIYKIACFSDKVTVENITAQILAKRQKQAEMDALKAAQAEAAKKAAAEKAEADKKAAEVKALLEKQLPQEMAKRAAVVAITNYCVATDVFKSDGNTLDVSKFHSYADTSGNFFDYYIGVKSWGKWSAKDENTWQVEKLVYVNGFGNEKNATLNAQYDGENYIISNVITSFGNLNDPSKSGIEEYSTDFVVAPKLIKDDRTQTRLDSYHSWVMNQFSSRGGSHKNLTELIKKNLNDEKSFKHIETNYQIIHSEDIKATVNKTLKSANKTEVVEIGDIWLSTEFSAKNSFNATIKNTAYGIVFLKTNNIMLVAIE